MTISKRHGEKYNKQKSKFIFNFNSRILKGQRTDIFDIKDAVFHMKSYIIQITIGLHDGEGSLSQTQPGVPDDG